jgi:putative Holliday junction resolvase
VDPVPDPKERGRVIAVDFGRARVGLALSDELRMIARPLAVLDGADRLRLVHEIARVCRAEGVTRVLVGLPLHMTGEVGASARAATDLAQRVADATLLEVEMVDERLTTVEAERLRGPAGRPRGGGRGKRPAPVDDVAAAVLLQAWLDGQ